MQDSRRQGRVAAVNGATLLAAADCPLQAMKTVRWLTSEPSVLPAIKDSGAISQLVSEAQGSSL
jgi:hypothetical protein